jgi:hypothetical protein
LLARFVLWLLCLFEYTKDNPFLPFHNTFTFISFCHLFGPSQHAQRLTLSVVDTFIADLKSSVQEAKESPSGKGTMVAVYGTFPFLVDASFCLSIICRSCHLCSMNGPFILLSLLFFYRDIGMSQKGGPVLFHSIAFIVTWRTVT